MFAPDHEASARELARVVKPGGTDRARELDAGREGPAAIFRIMKPFQPTPPEGVGFPFDWGDEQHVNDLLGDSFDLEIEQWRVTAAPTERRGVLGALLVQLGPHEDARRVARRRAAEELHRSWVDFADTELASNGEIEHEREWVLVYGTRR